MNTDLNFLTKDDIAVQAPVVLSTSPTNDVSDRYTYASTETVIDDLGSLGWYPTQVSQRKARKNSTRFSPHMVKFANPDLRINDGEGDVSFPQIVLQNSYDGLSSMRFTAGIFRLVCSNGLIIDTAKFGELKIAHKGYSFDEMRDMVRGRTEAIPEQIDVMNDMRGRMLTREEQEYLALEAMAIRSDVTPENKELFKGKIDKVTLNDILTPERSEDRGQNLWNTYQVVQEKMIKGGFHTQLGVDAKVRKVREIKSFEKDLSLNKQLFEVAKELI